MKEQYQVHVAKDVHEMGLSQTVGLYLTKSDGVNTYAAKITWKKVDPYVKREPTITEECNRTTEDSSILESIRYCMRSDKKLIEEVQREESKELTATKFHLEDMRKLALKEM